MGRHYIQSGQTLFTFNSGVTVKIFPVSSALLAEVRKLFPEPQPPIVETTNEDGISFREENRADPDYIRAHDAWYAKSNLEFAEMLVKMGVEIDPADINQARLDRVKGQLKKQFNLDLGDDDNYAYIRYILMADEEETQQVFDAVASRSKPEEVAIMRVLETFPDQAQG